MPVAPGFSALTVVLLFALVLTPALSVVSARWVEGLSLLLWLAMGGALLGLVFARLRLPALPLHVVGCVLGELLAIWAVASTLQAQTTQGQVQLLARRLVSWFAVVQSGGTVTDTLLFLLLLCCVAWFVGYTSAYSVVRQASPWWAILANGAALLTNLAYVGRADFYLPAFLLASMLLVARLHLAAQEWAWRAHGFAYPRGVGGSSMSAGTALAVALLGVAFLLPNGPSVQRQVDQVRAMAERHDALGPLNEARAELERLFGGIPARDVDAASGFGSSLTLQGEFKLGPELVAEVQSPRGRYWRAVTFQDYTGRGWRATTSTTAQTVAADEAHPAAYRARVDLEQKVTMRANRGDAAIAAAQPTRLGMGVSAEFSGGVVGDPLSLDLVSSLRTSRVRVPGIAYTVSSSVSVADEAALRAAGTDYPDAIRQRYAQPPETTARVRELARRLAPRGQSPYDRAKAIEAHLRTLTYALQVPVPPPGRDGVDFFVFDSKTGYCDYFATAMVVMLRSVGVPARVASGYAVGQQDPATGNWLVRDANAHSWVEVYFPRYGWIEFEPSPIRPTVQRGPGGSAEEPAALPASLATPTPAPGDPPLESSSAAVPTPASQPDPTPTASRFSIVPILWALGVVAGLAVVAVCARIAWGWGIDGLPDREIGYARMARLAWLLRRGPTPSQTPHEFADRLASRMPEEAASVARLANAFAQSRFAPRGTEPPHSGLEAAWRRVRRALLGRAMALR
jgi:hypothetical protein